MVLSERQLRFIVRQELLTYLNEQERIDEGILDKIRAEIAKYGVIAAMGTSILSAGAGVANVPDVNTQKEILHVLEQEAPAEEKFQSVQKNIKENFVFNKSDDGGYDVKFKNPDTGVVNEKNVLKVPSEVVEQARELGKKSDYKQRQQFLLYHGGRQLKKFIDTDLQAFIDGDAQLKQYQSDLHVTVFFFSLAILILVGTATAELMSEPPKGSYRPSKIPIRRRY
jgi:hypothetical protein